MKYRGDVVNGTIATFPTKRHSFNLDNTDSYIKILNPNLSSDFDTGYFNDIIKTDTPYQFSKSKAETEYEKYAQAHFREMDRREYEDRRFSKISEGFDEQDRLGPGFQDLYQKGNETLILEDLKDLLSEPVSKSDKTFVDKSTNVVLNKPKLESRKFQTDDDLLDPIKREDYIKQKTQESARKFKQKMEESMEFTPETPAPTTKKGRKSKNPFPTPPSTIDDNTTRKR